MDAEGIKKLASKGVDFEDGIDRFAGNEELYIKFVCRYADDTHLNLLKEALEKNNTEEGFRVAHTLKGVVGTLSFTTYYELLTSMVDLLRLGKIDEAKALMGQVEQAHAQVIEALETL